MKFPRPTHLVVLCHSQEQAGQVKARLAEWLAPRGLAFNEGKTQIVHLSEGFDFLGFNVRRYRHKLLVKPSKAAVARLRARLAAEMRALRGSNALAVIAKLNPIIKGWAAYYRGAVSKRIFASLDHYLWKLLYKWSAWSHSDKPKSWIVDRYFGKRNKFRNDHWVFGAPGTSAYVVRFAWTDIVRHILVKGGASPDDPAGRVLGQPAAEGQTPVGQLHDAPAHQAGCSLPVLQGPPSGRRPATRVARTMGTVVAATRPQGDLRGLPGSPRKTQPAARR